jgi:ferredoxin
MGEKAFLPDDKVRQWIDELSRTYSVLVPRQVDDSIVFQSFDPEAEIPLDRQPTVPPKEALFPKSETLLLYKYDKDPEQPGRQKLSIKERQPAEKQVVFGARPCGARGFSIFDPVFEQGEYQDPYYQARRENTLFITVACSMPENTCFCHWVGGSPADPTGSDILLVPVQSGYLVEQVTERAGPLLSSKLLEEAGAAQEEGQKVKQAAADCLEEPPDLTDLPERLLQLFDNLDFWDKASAKCISCGACTYLCPTCYCFNITDEPSGMAGRRLRSWDNCMSYLFTLEGSGHNPRPTKAHRLRNRVGHKFSYYPELHERVFACCGCGRCIKSCPVCVDIREIVTSAKEYRDE